MFLKLAGFAPDTDQMNPGVITDLANMVPSMKGYKGAPSPVDQGVVSLSGTCVGAAVLRLTDDTARFIAGTPSNLFERQGSSWTSRAEGTYALGADDRWRFLQNGDVTLAVTKQVVMQAYQGTGGASFSTVTGAPQAAVGDVVLDFVMVGNTNEASFSESPQRVMWSGAGNYAQWTPRNATTQAGTDNLTDIPGGITALKTLGDQAVVYKNRGIHLGTYEGPPFIWTFQTIPGTVGTPCQEAVVNVGFAHIFFGYEGIYIFDGVRPQRISTDIDEFIFVTRLDRQYAHRISHIHDRGNSRIYWFYPRTGGSGALNGSVVLNYRNMRWGVDDRTIGIGIEFISGQTTIDGLDALASTIDTLPDIPFDSPFWSQYSTLPAYIGSNGKVYVLNGAAGASVIETGDYGQDNVISLVSRVRPRFATTPSSASLTHKYRDQLGQSTTSTSVDMSSGKFDALVSSRWHRERMACSGSAEVYGFDVDIEADGEE
ncbi:MAG TPA: hypothetical protein VFU31_24570 [Candidatus Binatia bacterium]|nr:hypothetical protein [Candidatus Binatia bacterium]